MFISPSSFTVKPTLFASVDNVRSARTYAYPWPGSLPLSTLLAPLLSYTSVPSGSRSLPSQAYSPMSPNRIDVINFMSQSSTSSSISSSSDLPSSSTDRGSSLGTDFFSSSVFGSNSDISPAFTLWPTTYGTMLTSTSATLFSLSFLGTNLPSESGCTSASTPRSTLPLPTSSITQTASSLLTSSYSVPQSTNSPWSPPVSTSSIPTDATVTMISSTTEVSSIGPAFSSLNLPSTSTYTTTSILLVPGGTTTYFVTSSGVLSTESPGSIAHSTVPISPGTISAIVLGIVGAFAFAALWLYCARRRHRKLVQEAALVSPENYASGPLDDEILDVEELPYEIRSTQNTGNSTSRTSPVMEERYAGILAAMHSAEMLGRGNEGGSTGGIYGSHRDTTTDIDDNDNLTRASSPTLPLHAIPPDDSPHTIPLSPPPPTSSPLYHQTTHPHPPPSAYHLTSCRKGSSGPDASAWLSGYNVAPSCNSHYARSHTLGSGSGSGSVDALTRTRTGSEEPLLCIGKATSEVSAGLSVSRGASPTIATDPGSNRLGLGSAFGSPPASIYSPSGIYTSLQHDTSGSYDGRTASGSGSYGHARSGTPSSFDVLRSVSSQGALSSAYNHGHDQSQGFRFGFSKSGSSSSGSAGKKAASDRRNFGVPPTSFRAWKGSVSTEKEKEKQGLTEKDWRQRTRNSISTSTSESLDEKEGRGSPVRGVRALLGRLRRAGYTSSPHSSNKDLPSTQTSMDMAADRATPPPILIQAATPPRRRYSFILSNPDPFPPSPYSGVDDVLPTSNDSPHQESHLEQQEVLTYDSHNIIKSSPSGARELQPTTLQTRSAPSPVPTEGSRLAEGLLHPRLQIQGCSDTSLRDFEDYSRPIGGVVKNRMYSATTFGTLDDMGTCQSQGTLEQDDDSGTEQLEEHETEVIDVFGASALEGFPRDG